MQYEISLWLIGGLIGIVGALVAMLWSLQSSEIKVLRDWRHATVEPALRKLGEVDYRVTLLEQPRHGKTSNLPKH